MGAAPRVPGGRRVLRQSSGCCLRGLATRERVNTEEEDRGATDLAVRLQSSDSGGVGSVAGSVKDTGMASDELLDC